jgi:uncharacterized protein YraI
MSLRSFAFVVATAGAVAVPAVAEAAYTTGSVNLRYGPGVNYQVITTLPPGAYVAVNRCTGGWCLVNAVGTSGWLSASFVSGGGAYYPPPRPRYYYQPVYPAYPYSYGYPYRYGGPGYYYPGPSYGFYFNFGHGHRHW